MARSANDAAIAPKYALIERERRWLVAESGRPALDGLPFVVIEDRYLIGTRCRLRRAAGSDGGAPALKLTRKYETDDPRARPIVTAYLTEGEYAVFAALPAHQLVKRRYRIVVDGLTWSVDCFEGALAGLELVEIELADEDGLCAVVPPAWIACEITDDPRYQGGSLAVHGIPKEK